MMAVAFVSVSVCIYVSVDECPQHLSGNLAVSRALPMRAGKHAVMDLTLHMCQTQAYFHHCIQSSAPHFSLQFLSFSALNDVLHGNL